MKVFVRGFNNKTRLSEIADLFERCGKVESVRLRDDEKQHYTIVEMPDLDAWRAIRRFNATELNGRRVEVSESNW